MKTVCAPDNIACLVSDLPQALAQGSWLLLGAVVFAVGLSWILSNAGTEE